MKASYRFSLGVWRAVFLHDADLVLDGALRLVPALPVGHGDARDNADSPIEDRHKMAHCDAMHARVPHLWHA